MSENTYHSTIANENIAIDSVTKRDGTLAPFDSNKIYNAIKKAGESTGEFGESESWLLTSQVLKVLKHKFSESLPTIEHIQDIVEQVLISANYFATAKAYILYRDQRNRARTDRKVMVDVESSINEYLEKLGVSNMKFSKSSWCAKGTNDIKIVVDYDIKTEFPFFDLGTRHYRVCASTRVWAGS